MRQSSLLLFSAFIFCCSLNSINAHNHLIWPVPRDPRTTYAGDNNCENGNKWFPNGNNFRRGQDIQTKWSFNNHRGGFARFSIVPMGREGQGGIFNQPENIVHYTCHTRTCGGAGVRFDPGDTIPCTTNFKIPTHLKDGEYVMQWVVYSMHDSDGNPDKGLPNYISCANIKINGGPQTNERPGKCSFTWAGGDKEYTRTKGPSGTDTCVYFMRNTLGSAWDTVKINRSFIKTGGRPAEVEACLRNGGLGKVGGGGTIQNDNNNNNNNSNGQCNKHHQVKSGDTCWGIAQANGLSVDELVRKNGIKNCDEIWVGATFCVER